VPNLETLVIKHLQIKLYFAAVKIAVGSDFRKNCRLNASSLSAPRPMPLCRDMPSICVFSRLPRRRSRFPDVVNFMSTSPSPNASSPRALSFLAQNPELSHSLLAEVGSDLSQIATFVEPILDAPSRCEISIYYIQAVTTGRTAFLTTNLPDVRSTHVTQVSTNWVIGRSRTCAIAVPSTSISRCHAVIGFCLERGFYVIDLGSSNGTFVNRRRLHPQEQRFLNDGDLLELSHTRLEFFVSGWRDSPTAIQETLG